MLRATPGPRSISSISFRFAGKSATGSAKAMPCSALAKRTIWRATLRALRNARSRPSRSRRNRTSLRRRGARVPLETRSCRPAMSSKKGKLAYASTRHARHYIEVLSRSRRIYDAGGTDASTAQDGRQTRQATKHSADHSTCSTSLPSGCAADCATRSSRWESSAVVTRKDCTTWRCSYACSMQSWL